VEPVEKLRTPELRVDVRALREHTALVHALPSMVLTFVWDDGRHMRVSHDSAFRPALTPCLLRRAVGAHLDPHDGPVLWLTRVVAVEAGGPFVEPLPCNAFVDHADERQPVHFTSLRHPEHVHELLHAASSGAGTDGIDVHLSVDSHLAVTTLRFAADSHVRARAAAVDVANACRAAERTVGLRSA
jgi:hypothetical protein